MKDIDMNILGMTLVTAALLAVAGCVVSPAPGYYGDNGYHGNGSLYYAVPAHNGGPYLGRGDEFRGGDHGYGDGR